MSVARANSDRNRVLLAYGAFGLPLSFAALPLHLILPDWYAREMGMPLVTIGALLLAARLADALVDPAIGTLLERVRPRRGYRWPLLVALPILAAGFTGLFHPPSAASPGLLAAWLLAMLVVTYAGYSTATIAWQSWGAAMGGSEVARTRLTSTREIFGIVGVLVASVLPLLAGMSVTAAVLAALLLGSALLLLKVPEVPVRPGHQPAATLRHALKQPAFRKLLLVFALSGLSAAIPGTLLLFFVRDALQLASWSPLFLVLYFCAAALAMPMLTRLVAHIGTTRCWLAGMALSVLAFSWVPLLPGAQANVALSAFALVCVLSGMAVATDLALPAALLAGLIERAGDRGRAEAAYFGIWNFIAKLALALAAGCALPLLQWGGYTPGQTGQAMLLTLAYAALPCLLRLCAAALLWRWRREFEPLPLPAAPLAVAP